MIFSDLLKAQGLSEEQVKVIYREMAGHRIFITKEEKIEERYRKMKLQRDELKGRLKQAQETLEELNRTLRPDLAEGNPKQESIIRPILSKEEVKKKHDQ